MLTGASFGEQWVATCPISSGEPARAIKRL